MMTAFANRGIPKVYHAPLQEQEWERSPSRWTEDRRREGGIGKTLRLVDTARWR